MTLEEIRERADSLTGSIDSQYFGGNLSARDFFALRDMIVSELQDIADITEQSAQQSAATDQTSADSSG